MLRTACCATRGAWRGKPAWWAKRPCLPVIAATAAVFVSLESARIVGCEHALCARQGEVLDLGRGARPCSRSGAVRCVASRFRQRQQVQRHGVVQHLAGRSTLIIPPSPAWSAASAPQMAGTAVTTHTAVTADTMEAEQHWRQVQRVSPAPGGAPGRRRWWRSSAGTGTSGAPAHGGDYDLDLHHRPQSAGTAEMTGAVQQRSLYCSTYHLLWALLG